MKSVTLKIKTNSGDRYWTAQQITKKRALMEVKIMNQLIRYNENGVFKITPKDNEHYWVAIACAGIARDLFDKNTCNGGYIEVQNEK